MIIATYVTDYIQRFRPAKREEIAFFAKQATLSDAIRIAATCQRADGKRHPHQRRIPRAVLGAAERKLRAEAQNLSTAKSFEELHAIVDSLIGPIAGVGELTVYDIAHRIGAFLGFEPVNVYLHAGTRAGAAALGFHGRVIERDRLPNALAQLTAAEIEDFLCIFKDHLRSAGAPTAGFVNGAKVSACLTAKRRPARRC